MVSLGSIKTLPEAGLSYINAINCPVPHITYRNVQLRMVVYTYKSSTLHEKTAQEIQFESCKTELKILYCQQSNIWIIIKLKPVVSTQWTRNNDFYTVPLELQKSQSPDLHPKTGPTVKGLMSVSLAKSSTFVYLLFWDRVLLCSRKALSPDPCLRP